MSIRPPATTRRAERTARETSACGLAFALALAGTAAVGMAPGCNRTGVRAPAAHPGSEPPPPAVSPAAVTTRAPEAPDDDACAPRADARTAPGWSLTGFRPGPALHDLLGVDKHRIAGVTARRVCTSDDGGRSWTERFSAREPGTSVRVRALGDGAWLLTEEREEPRPGRGGAIATAWASRDGAMERWDAVELPLRGAQLRGLFADKAGRLYAAGESRLLVSDDAGTSWAQPRALPGSEATEVDACGSVLIARARVGEDWYYHRSFDRGESWRPFRLGAIGLEGNGSLLRCVSTEGGIEAGRAPLPSHWSFDGGHTWSTAPYDGDAQRLARAASEAGGSRARVESPHCLAGPAASLACADAGRLRLFDRRFRVQEIHGPAGCEHVRQVDARRTFAFGPSCGLYESTDRGGDWRAVSQSAAPRPAGQSAEGRGGFIDGRTAWRVDGGVWWTFDGGVHWQRYFSITARALERGVFVSRYRGVFATNTGWVVSTRDGGRSWTYVLRGDVERITSAGRTVMVTTAQSVRFSPDGGATWMASAPAGTAGALDPTVESSGGRRTVLIAPGVRVGQDESGLWVQDAGGGRLDVAQGLPRGYRLLAAHATRGRVDRVLLDGGVVLARATTPGS